MQKSACIAEISTKVTMGYFLCSPCIVGVVVLAVHSAASSRASCFLTTFLVQNAKNVKLHLNGHLRAYENLRIIRAKCTQRHLKS